MVVRHEVTQTHDLLGIFIVNDLNNFNGSKQPKCIMPKADADLLLEQFNVTVKGKISKDYYVYVYEDQAGVPFYVGIGSRNGVSYTYHRCYQHLNSARKGVTSHLCRKLRKMQRLSECIVIRIVRCSSQRQTVCELEKKLILEYGPVNEGGTLCNLADGGDGGTTVRPGSRKITDGKTTRMLPRGARLPEGWVYGEPERARPRVACYCPKTGRRTRVYTTGEVPKGWILGAPSGVATGPRGKQIWHNPKSGKMFWLSETDPKRGLVKGRSNKGSTAGRMAVYCAKTDRTRFIEKGEQIPRGFKLGQKHKPSAIKGTKVYHNPSTLQIFYVNPNEQAPKGSVEGRPSLGYTPWSWYHDPKTDKPVRVPKGDTPPKGCLPGLAKSHSSSYSKPCSYNGKRYPSVTDCVRDVGMTRYILTRQPEFKFE